MCEWYCQYSEQWGGDVAYKFVVVAANSLGLARGTGDDGAAMDSDCEPLQVQNQAEETTEKRNYWVARLRRRCRGVRG